MVHALRALHRAIRSGGYLLDIHPQPQMPRVIVDRAGLATSVGFIDWTSDNREILAARRRLAAIQREGLFRIRDRARFETADSYDSVDEWLESRRRRGATSVVPPPTIRRARAEMRRGPSRLVVRLRVRATLLDRRPASGR